MDKKTKVYDSINGLLDIIITFLIQIFIIFLIIVIPGIITVMKEISSSQSAELVFRTISTESVKNIIIQNPLIKGLIIAGSGIALIAAPILYERGRRNTGFVKQYLKGLHIDLKQFLNGIFIGAFGFLAVVLWNLISGRMQGVRYSITMIDFGCLLLLLLSVSLYIICEELFCRYYVMLKAIGPGKIFYFVISNIIFIYAEGRSLSDTGILVIVNLCLLSTLMTILAWKTGSISIGAGYRIAFTFLSFVIFNADMLFVPSLRIFHGIGKAVSGRATGLLNYALVSIVLLVLNSTVLFQLMKRRDKS